MRPGDQECHSTSPKRETIKAMVYVDIPQNLQELKEAITKEISPIDTDLLERVMRNFEKRLQQCIAENGRHLPDIIFGTFQFIFRNFNYLLLNKWYYLNFHFSKIFVS